MPVKSKEFEYAFALNKQTDILTAIDTTKLTKKLPMRGFAPFFTDPQAMISDRNWYGKGHSHPTFYDQLTKLVRVPSREFSMTQLSALVPPAFVLGSLASTRPNSATAPTVYDHTLTFQDPTTNPEVLYTTLIVKASAEYQEILSGVVINSFNVVGARADHVVIGYEGIARKKAADVTAMPSLAASQSFFKILKGTFSFGAVGAAADISTKTLSFNMNVSQNADITTAWLPGATSGQENLMSKVLIGDQTVSGQLVAFLDSTRRNLFENQTECELTITLLGDAIGVTGYYHTITITIPHLKLSAATYSEEGQTTALTMVFDENSVLKAEGEDFFRWKVRTNIDATDLLVAA